MFNISKIIMEKIISTNNMNKRTLPKQTKSQPINPSLKQNVKQQLKNEVKKRIRRKRGNTHYEFLTSEERENLAADIQEREHIKKLLKNNVRKIAKALKGYTKSYEIAIKHNKDPLKHLKRTRIILNSQIMKNLTSMKGLKFVETLKVTFKKLVKDGTSEKTAYFNSKAQADINNTEILEASQLTKQQILNMIAQWVSEGSGWTIQSVDNHHLNIVQYQPMKGSSYIELPQELRNSKKGLINMKNEDNECFRWCHIRHLNPQDKDSQRIKKSDKDTLIDWITLELNSQ